jgi:hypothetical protein
MLHFPVSALAYDVAFERVSALVDDMAERKAGRNEATTRLQLVDRLIFDCLGWSRDQAILEERENGDYADYVLKRPRETARRRGQA